MEGQKSSARRDDEAPVRANEEDDEPDTAEGTAIEKVNESCVGGRTSSLVDGQLLEFEYSAVYEFLSVSRPMLYCYAQNNLLL
jgi:hypothetical protein